MVSLAKNNDNLIARGKHTIWFWWDQWPLRVHIHHRTISVNQTNEPSLQRGSSLTWHHCLTRNYLPYFSYTDENVRCKPGKITRLCATFCKKLWRRKKMIKRKRLSKRRKPREKKRLPRNKRAVAREINDPAILHIRFLLHDLCADVVHINDSSSYVTQMWGHWHDDVLHRWMMMLPCFPISGPVAICENTSLFIV